MRNDSPRLDLPMLDAESYRICEPKTGQQSRISETICNKRQWSYHFLALWKAAVPTQGSQFGTGPEPRKSPLHDFRGTAHQAPQPVECASTGYPRGNGEFYLISARNYCWLLRFLNRRAQTSTAKTRTLMALSGRTRFVQCSVRWTAEPDFHTLLAPVWLECSRS